MNGDVPFIKSPICSSHSTIITVPLGTPQRGQPRKHKPLTRLDGPAEERKLRRSVRGATGVV